MSTPVYSIDVPVFYGLAEVFFDPTGSGVVEELAGGIEQEAYARMLAALLPRGPAWSVEAGGVLLTLLGALAAELARVDQRSRILLDEADPRTAAEMLGDWERVFGLPDPCVEAPQTIAERRQALLGRVTGQGGQSRAFFVALAASLGYEVTITEFASEAAAISAGIPYSGTSWAHTWRVNVAEATSVREFRAGSGAAGEPLRSWGNEVLECQFQRLKPAHTSVLFAYPT